MYKKSKHIFTILFLALLFSSIHADTVADFDKLVDFSITLRDFYSTTGNAAGKPVTDKIVMLDGTLSIVYPTKAYGFLYTESEILFPALFIKKLEKPGDNLTQFLADQLSSRTKGMFGSEPADKTLPAIVKDLNAFIRNKRFYSEDLFARIKIPGAIKALLSLDLKEDELAFVNRLLMDLAFTGVVKPVEIQVEIINGIWYGYERVESYIGIFRFYGAEAFRVFTRSDPTAALSGRMIPLNTRIIIAARALQKVKREEYENEVWMFDTIYVREIK